MPAALLSPVRTIKTPFPRPQALSFDGRHFWIASYATHRIYAVDPLDFSVLKEYEAPGRPYGLVCVGDELRVLCGMTDEDNRLIYRVRDGVFQPDPTPCPDDTGSQLSFDGTYVYVSQWYRKRLLALDDGGRIVASHEAPRGIAGHVIVGPHAYLLGTDDEAVTPYWITRLTLATGECEDVGILPFLARGLSHDGRLFWSNVREQDECIAFELP